MKSPIRSHQQAFKIRFISRNHLLNAAGTGFEKNSRDHSQIERHHMRAALGDFIQPLLIR